MPRRERLPDTRQVDHPQVQRRRPRRLHHRRPVPRRPARRAVHHHGQGRQHDRRPDGLLRHGRLDEPAIRRAARSVRQQVLAHALRADGATPRTPTSASPRASSTTSSAGWASRSCPATRKPAWASLPTRRRAERAGSSSTPTATTRTRSRARRQEGRRAERSGASPRSRDRRSRKAAAAKAKPTSATGDSRRQPRPPAPSPTADSQRPRQRSRQRPRERPHGNGHGNGDISAALLARAGVMLKDARPEHRPQRAIRRLPIRRPGLRQLRRDHRPQRQLLPLPQLRQQHGLFVTFNRDAR